MLNSSSSEKAKQLDGGTSFDEEFGNKEPAPGNVDRHPLSGAMGQGVTGREQAPSLDPLADAAGDIDSDAIHLLDGHNVNMDYLPGNEVASEPASDTIDVDLNLSDTDSTLGMSTASSTFSLRDSVYEYIEEYGRTYHAYKAGAYRAPNDEKEQERLDLQHHLFRMTMNGSLYAAPVTNLRDVLDIATGTGIWAIELAQEYPTARVIGMDLSPIQPAFIPINHEFFMNLSLKTEDEWTFTQKPRTVIASIFSALTPGGYFELQDVCFPCKSPDGTLEGTSLQQWQTLMVDGLRKLGKDFEKVKEYGTYMREAGFVDVVEKKYTWAIGPWIRGKKQKPQATWWAQNFLNGIHGWSMAIVTRGMGWTPEEVEVLLAGVRDDVKNYRNVHAYVQMYVVYGKTPP
ncbi:hypothetical protein BP6252_08237 [Coleophoma cylindrospora]|uniref:S-adenosyl-L-methionine-dependent methyltransferase n=1 Tax=Coleophoma cylindrospora TaxID=1849047 RepID=A0A3D8R5E3_9HELO|nr:hypothetical protein BP6252_08237 [Coleophoma cylindrospora]